MAYLYCSISGIDTVSLNGEGFQVFVENGQKVKKGEKLMEIDIDFLKAHAPSLCSPVLCTELEDSDKVRLLAEGRDQSRRTIICNRQILRNPLEDPTLYKEK